MINICSHGPVQGKIDLFTTALEEIATNDPEFTECFGTKFHRDIRSAYTSFMYRFELNNSQHIQGGSSGKRKSLSSYQCNLQLA
ncbi:hypothetical protein VTO42DRAFT_439 [Malbranchea cinnamomea]